MVARENLRAMGKLRTSIMTRLRGMVTRARVAASVVTGQGQILTLDLYEDEQRDSVEYLEPYGISGAVPPGATCVAFASGGSRDHMIAVGASPKGGIPAGKLPGEVDYWCTHGQKIRHHASGDTSHTAGPTGLVYLGSEPNPLLPFVNGHGDQCIPTAIMLAWMNQVNVALADPGILAVGSMAYVPPVPTATAPISTTVASATNTKVS